MKGREAFSKNRSLFARKTAFSSFHMVKMPDIMGAVKRNNRSSTEETQVEVVAMMVVKNYVIHDVEYMVVNGIRDYMPGREGIRLLAHRRSGVGADRVILFTGSGQEPSFRLYGASGEMCVAGRDEYLILAHYLRSEGIAVNAAEFVRYLGDEVMSVTSEKISTIEIRITDSFLAKLKERDEASSAVA